MDETEPLPLPSADRAKLLLRAAETMGPVAPSGKMTAAAALPEALGQPEPTVHRLGLAAGARSVPGLNVCQSIYVESAACTSTAPPVHLCCHWPPENLPLPVRCDRLDPHRALPRALAPKIHRPKLRSLLEEEGWRVRGGRLATDGLALQALLLGLHQHRRDCAPAQRRHRQNDGWSASGWSL